MASIRYDLTYLQEALDSVENFLLSTEIFWNLPVKPPQGEAMVPALTLSGILLAQKRLAARKMAHADSTEFEKLHFRFEVVRSRWRTAWEQKAAADYSARLTQWRNFLEDYRGCPADHVDRYPYEIRLRVMLDLLDQGNPYIAEENANY
jgi:hypothetical protein